MSGNTNTMDMKKLSKKLNSVLTAIDGKALEGMTLITYMKKDPDIDEAARANLNRWESNLLRIRAEV